MTERLTLVPYGFTGQSRAVVGNGSVKYARDSVNIDTHRGESWGSRGFSRYRFVAAGQSVPCASWLHTHTDDGSTPVYLVDGELFPETGSDSPAALATGLTTSWKPIFVNLSQPAGVSVFINGTNSEAKIIRENGSNVLEAVAMDFAAPTGATATPSTTGGSLADDTYYVRVVAVDDPTDTSLPSVDSGPQDALTATVSGGGGSGSISVSIGSATIDSRATHWKVYVSSTTTAYASYLLEATTVIGTTSVVIQSLTGTETIPNINEFPRVAVMPLADVDSAWLHDGRLWIASTKSSKVYFSERGNPNHWYSINEAIAGAESGWSSGVIGGISAFGSSYVFTRRAIHRVFGNFTRDDQGTNPTYILNIGQEIVTEKFGLVGPNAITHVGDYVYFYSEQGLAMLQGASTRLVSPDDEQGILDRFDTTYLDRIVLTEDPNGYVCILAARFTNSSRPHDGASVAGVADRIYRWDYRHNVWAPPLAIGDITHIISRGNPSAGGTVSSIQLMASNSSGYVYRLNHGWSGGGPLDVSASDYDGKLCSSNTATTATFVLAGITNDDFNGMTVAIYYPTDDTNFPGNWALKTILDTAVAGSTVVITWAGDLTVPSSSGLWTVRIAGLPCVGDLPAIIPHPTGTKLKIKGFRYKFQHMIGEEAVS